MTLPMLRLEAPHITAPARRARPWGLVALLLLVVALLAPWAAFTDDLLGLRSAADGLRRASADATRTLDRLPETTRSRVGADVHLLDRRIDQALLRLEGRNAPLAEPAAVHDIHYLTDVVRAVDAELEAAPATAGPVLERRIDALVTAATTRLDALEGRIDAWLARTRDEVIEVERRGDVLVIESTDRLLHDAVRYTAAALFLVGLLVAGLRLLAFGQSGTRLRELVRHGPLATRAAGAAFALFLAGTLMLSLRPDGVVGPSARTLLPADGHPCRTLAAHREHLRATETAASPRLVAALKQRMRPAAEACLGLDGEMAAIEAVERMAARETGAARRAAAARAPAEPAIEPAIADLRDGLGRLEDQLQRLVPALVRAGATLRPSETADRTADETADEAAGGPATGPARAAPLPPRPAPRTYVTTTTVNYRVGPSAEARRLGTLRPGTPVLRLGEVDGWAEVELDGGRAAYVASRYLRRSG